MNYTHVRALVYDQPWAITPEKLNAIQSLLAMRLAGERLTPEAIAERIGAADARRNTVRNGAVAVLPIYGVLMQRVDMLSEMSGGTSTERIARDFRQLVADPNIGTIVLDIDSPGGGVYGIAELAEEIFKARADKRIVAVANSMAASAAYWLGTAADELVVTPGGEVGSIGVYMIHEDWSAAYEQAGVKPTLIKFGEHKAEGIDIEPLSDAAKDALQKRVDEYGAMFTNAVAKHRGTNAATVSKEFGQGRVFGAKEAVKRGMADRVGSLQETLVRLAGVASGKGARALMFGECEECYEAGQQGRVTACADAVLQDAKPPLTPDRAAAMRDLEWAKFTAPVDNG
jgi:signal peptide peptidase SppA